MNIQLSDNLIKHYLQNVYFINGHSYAGKSTMVKMLAERYDMIACGENYHDVFPREKLSRWKQPGLCYFDTMRDWQEWLQMTPKEHWDWCRQVCDECTQIEILELIKLAASGRKVVVDTNISPDILREISSYHRVAILLCDPPDICAVRFFDRDDPEKKFMMEQINKCPDPQAAFKNFQAWALYHPPMETDWAHTGFFTYVRSDFDTDTREEMLSALAKHFGLQEK